jgi:phosphoglycerate dehydrogenase-like enzyme
MAPPVLFCSSGIWSDHGESIRAAAPGIDAVTFRTGQRVADDDIARITIAFASDDLYPAGLPGFFRVCLDAPGLEWVQVFNAGIDHPVFHMLLNKGARLTTGSGTSAVPIAQHVVMCLLALIRDLPGSIARQQRHEWQPRQVPDVEGRTLGVLGLGPIGSEVARLASHFGMNVIGLRRTVTGFELCETWTIDRLDELLGAVDDLVLALPLTADTRHIIGARELSLMRPGTRLVNVGRGELVDETAMVDALRSGQLGGAALDVFTVEPLPPDSPLWDMPNVIITPHNSGDSAMATRRVNELFLANLGHWHRGETLQNEVASDVAGGDTPG